MKFDTLKKPAVNRKRLFKRIKETNFEIKKTYDFGKKTNESSITMVNSSNILYKISKD